jgi:hypothetical protein
MLSATDLQAVSIYRCATVRRGFQAHMMRTHLYRFVKVVSGGMSECYAYGHGLQFLMGMVSRIAMPVPKARHDNFSFTIFHPAVVSWRRP